MPNDLPYDPASRDSIIAHAERLVDHSLREALESLPDKIDFSSHKGSFGTTLERHYFGYKPNSNPEPDFAQAGLELKATPLKIVRGELVAKERLVLSMIDYAHVISEEWGSSTFLKKNSYLLLVFYLHEADKDPLDFIIKIVRMWEFPAEDLEIIRQDWQTIIDKVKAGQAHGISEGDTTYLAACTKGAKGTDRRRQPNSPELAKPRAFALKASYMNSVIDSSRRLKPVILRPVVAAEVETGMSFEDAIADRFTPYMGLAADDIAARLGLSCNPRPKSFYALLTNRILGLGEKERAAEFAKGDIQVKTMRLLPNRRPKEDISFPAFNYLDLVEQEWERSDLREALTKRFFFVIYQLDEEGTPRLAGTRFWTMPIEDVDSFARECFDETIYRIREDRAEYLPKKSEGHAVHVRPHGRDSSDTLPTPSGRLVCKKSFWLNGSYIRDQLGF